MKRTKLVPILLLIVLVGCAVHKVPQISSETQWRLNTAAQLSQANKDYITFFTDLGDAQRAGYVTTSQVEALNSIGHNLKTSLEIANQEWNAFVANPDDSRKTAVINAILKAEQILLQLTAARANMRVQS